MSVDKRLLELYAIIGNNVIRLRGKRGKMSQELLAKKAGLSRSTVSAIESGRAIRLEALFKIADVLQVNMADLFISDEAKEEVSYMHILLLKKISESLGIKPGPTN